MQVTTTTIEMFWAKERKIGYSTINARAETVATRPSFRDAFRHRRCLIAADGFYEWKQLEGRKQPYYIGLKDPQPFVFAGLWEHWEGGGEIIDSCAIIVTQANELVGEIHNRMPVILDQEDAERMIAYPISTRVNNPGLTDGSRQGEWPRPRAIKRDGSLTLHCCPCLRRNSLISKAMVY